MNYGKALRIARAATKLQQKEVAKRSKLDTSYVSLIEAGKRTPSIEAVESLSEAFKIPKDLFELLASEPEDIKTVKSEDVNKLARELLSLLVLADDDK